MVLFSRLKTSVEQQEWQLLQFPLQDFLSSFLSLWQDFFSDLPQQFFSVLQQSDVSDVEMKFCLGKIKIPKQKIIINIWIFFAIDKAKL